MAGFAAVKLPCIETSVMVPKVKPVAGAVGVAHAVVAIPVTVRLSMLIFGRLPEPVPALPLW